MKRLYTIIKNPVQTALDVLLPSLNFSSLIRIMSIVLPTLPLPLDHQNHQHDYYRPCISVGECHWYHLFLANVSTFLLSIPPHGPVLRGQKGCVFELCYLYD